MDMPLHENDTHLIDQYLTERLTKHEEQLFKARKKDASFQKELERHREISDTIRLKARKNLKSQLQNFDKKLQVDTKVIPMSAKKSKVNFRPWLIAASIALAILAVWWIFPTSTPDYYANYFEPYPNVIAPIQKSEQQTTIEQQAFQAYELKEYDKASTLFQQLESSDTNRFYEAMIALETEKYTTAVDYLENIIKNPDARFQQTARWYLALAYLKNEQTDKAKILLNEISHSEKHPFQEKAIKLQAEL
jgi:hypothetical protein